jgi:type IV secretion system protein VirB5
VKEAEVVDAASDVDTKTIEGAKRQFVEVYGSALVMNTYLKIALVLVSLVALALVALNFHTASRFSDVKPLVIRIDEVGRAEAVQYDATRYQPQPPELRYQSRTIEKFVTNPSADEIEIQVQNVSLTELAKPPFKAAVTFQKVHYSAGTRTERQRETFVAQVDFALRDHVPNEFVPVNPLGLQIDYFRVDQAFEEIRR